MKGRNARWPGFVAATVALCLLLPGGLAAQDKPLTPVRAAYVPVANLLIPKPSTTTGQSGSMTTT